MIMKTKIKIRKEMKEQIEKEKMAKQEIQDNDELEKHNMNEMNTLVKKPILLILGLCTFCFFTLFIICFGLIWYFQNNSKSIYVSIALSFSLLLLLIYDILILLKPNLNETPKIRILEALATLLTITFLIISMALIELRLTILKDKIKDYYIGIALSYTVAYFFLCLAFYLASTYKAVKKSQNVNTTINFGNILLTIAVTILTIIQVVSLFTDKPNQANDSKQPQGQSTSASYPSAPVPIPLVNQPYKG